MAIKGFPGGRGPDRPTKFVVPKLRASDPAANYALAGDAGSYLYTGQFATFNVGRKLAGANGSYAYAGRTATLTVGRNFAGANGGYTYTGQSATLTYASTADASSGIRRHVTHSLRRKKKEYEFLKEIREDLALEMYQIDAPSSAQLDAKARSRLGQNVALATQKYKKLSDLAKAYQVSIDGIDSALAFVDYRMNLLIEDEMLMVLTLIAADDS